VRPGTAPDVSKKTALRGFRTPALMISPLARRGHVSHRTYDHTSVLKMIEWRWGLKPLTPRDRAARNMAEALDFASGPDPTAPAYDVPEVVPVACAPDESKSADWAALKRLSIELGMRPKTW
jgi:phospholipase C